MPSTVVRFAALLLVAPAALAAQEDMDSGDGGPNVEYPVDPRSLASGVTDAVLQRGLTLKITRLLAF